MRYGEKTYISPKFQILSNDVVVDIGANIGVFNIYAAKKTKNKVYAFEPFPDNYKILKNNIFQNKLDNIQPYNYAISDYSGIVKLYVTESSAGNLLFDHNIQRKLDKFIEVQSITLQNAMDIKKSIWLYLCPKEIIVSA